MSSEADILERIAKLSGAIQHHKDQQPNNRGGYASFRGRGRGRGGHNLTLSNVATPTYSPTKTAMYHKTPNATSHSQSAPIMQRLPLQNPRSFFPGSPSPSPHRKLVLNGPSTPTSTTSLPSTPTHPQPSLVHSQHHKLVIHPKGVQSTPSTPTSVSRSVNSKGQQMVTINGINFIAKGKKLIREDCLNPSAASSAKGPKVLIRKTTRSIKRRDKNKNMVLGLVPKRTTTQRKHRRSQKGNMVLLREPEGYVRQGRSGKSLVLKSKEQRKQYCGIFTRYGKCPNRTRCPFEHDMAHRAICPRFLQGRCKKAASQCRLSHEPSPFIMPHCVHFQRGRCKNENCQFTHVGLRPDAPICRAFAMEGYCSKGTACHNKHLHVCPEFAETSKCSNVNCRLPHVAQKTEGRSAKMTGVVRPGSWVSADYFRAQKRALAEKQKEKAKAQTQTQTQVPTNEQAKTDTQMTEIPSREKEEEGGFVRLFEESDDEGWSQFQLKDDQESHDMDSLRFSDEDEEGEDEEEEGEGESEAMVEEGEMSDESMEGYEGEHEDEIEEVYEEASDSDEPFEDATSEMIM